MCFGHRKKASNTCTIKQRIVQCVELEQHTTQGLIRTVQYGYMSHCLLPWIDLSEVRIQVCLKIIWSYYVMCRRRPSWLNFYFLHSHLWHAIHSTDTCMPGHAGSVLHHVTGFLWQAKKAVLSWHKSVFRQILGMSSSCNFMLMMVIPIDLVQKARHCTD